MPEAPNAARASEMGPLLRLEARSRVPWRRDIDSFDQGAVVAIVRGFAVSGSAQGASHLRRTSIPKGHKLPLCVTEHLLATSMLGQPGFTKIGCASKPGSPGVARSNPHLLMAPHVVLSRPHSR